MNIVMIDNNYNFCDSLSKYLKSNGDIKVLKYFNNNSDAFKYIEENKNILDLVIMDLDIPDIRIENFSESASKDYNIIAFSETPETIQKHINCPYFQRIFHKPISFSNILNYISIQNGIETLESSKKLVLQTLSDIGFNLNHAGTTYLIEATAIALKNKIKKLSEIYTLVAYNHNTDPKIVGWSINNAINKAVKSSPENSIQAFFKLQDNRRLTAKYIISYFINYNLSKQ